jgi:HPt (histidine-containing phosphotransfer) domain-containing protein
MAANEPILDRDFAINQLGGNEELLEKMFDKFVSQYAEDANKVNTQIATKDFQEAQRTIHGIKGVSGNLGLKALQHACREAEEYLRGFDDSKSEEQLTQHINNFEKTLSATLIELTNYESTQNQSEKEISDTKANDALSIEHAKSTLNAAINSFQFIAPAELQKLLAALQPTSIDLMQLEKAISDLDYERAKSLLNA